MSGATFRERKLAFCVSMERRGMTLEGANYCISVGKRLRSIYALSRCVPELEDEALTSLRNMLHRLPPVRNLAAGESYAWEAIAGGLEDGDTTVLYVVPPTEPPAIVPLPDEAQAETPAAPPANTVEQILDQWGKPQKPAPPEVTAEQYRENFVAGSSANLNLQYQQGPRTWRNHAQAGMQIHDEIVTEHIDMEAMARQMMEAYRQSESGFLEALQSRQRHREAYGQATQPEWATSEHSEPVQQYIAELEERAKGEGWSAELRQTTLYKKFVNTLARALHAKKIGNAAGASTLQDHARSMYSALKIRHAELSRNRTTVEARIIPPVDIMALPAPAQTQSSLNQLREKEALEARRRARRGR